ncbi:metal-sulfur cluster assembly factor [Albibacterium profundi]|uniref:Metal-sulfur cluster assembly factor n=1 Tax=Albibacterium profundi TaxID=3134906 RepID=A0ABV5CD58_9SPHI
MELQISDPYFSEKSEIMTALYQVNDPELMVNIIDLGLVYDIDLSIPGQIKVVMTLTSKGCPLGHAIEQGVKNAVNEKFPNANVIVEIVWDPVWTFEEISAAGREQLGF